MAESYQDIPQRPEDEQFNDEINRFINSKNVASELSDEVLTKIGEEVKRGFELDEASRRDWLDKVRMWMGLATQVADKKSFPWPNAANIKYPLLSTAAMQFAARAYPALIPGPELVKGVVKSVDPDGQQHDRAKRVGRHMSYQIMCEMDGWEESMDKACLILPIVGCVFKKTYFDPLKNNNVSELVTAENLVVNYWSKSLEDAPRKTQLICLTKNRVEERKRMGLFLDVDLGDPVPYDNTTLKEGKEERTNIKQPSEQDATTPFTFLECHTWYDLDEDGYDEPWIITVEHKSGKVVRIVPRFSLEGVKTDESKKKIVRIEPDEYFTEFTFIPNPDGGVYGIGFGMLLGAINDTVNTVTNQLIDAGTLANMQSGFLGRNLRIRGGALKFAPGEWKQVDFTGDDIRKQVFPLVFSPPSDVLFKLLEALVGSGKELASVANIMVGEMPGQNTPATTTMATIEQALKVFTAIHKRLYRSLTKEYGKLFKLNKLYFDQEQLKYFTLNSSGSPEEAEIFQSDYRDSITVKPNADPNVVSEAQDLARATQLLQMIPLGTVNPQEATKRMLEAAKHPDIQSLMNVPPPGPSEKEIEIQGKQAIEQMKNDAKKEIESMKAMLKEQEIKFKAAMDLMEMRQEMQMKEQEHRLEMRHSAEMHQMDMQNRDLDSRLKRQQSEMLFDQKLEQQKQMTKQKESNGPSSGDNKG